MSSVLSHAQREFINGATPIYVIIDEIVDFDDYMANYLIVEQL